MTDPTFRMHLPPPGEALPGRKTPMAIRGIHAVTGRSLLPPFEGYKLATLGLGCFWGAERVFWQLPGVHVTAVGYAGGATPHPTYVEVCSGRTGHAEVVQIVFDPAVVSYERLLQVFWESHDPTQGMRQGNDVGTQYRSAIFTHDDAQLQIARASRQRYQIELERAGHGKITTEISAAGPFYFAEEDHQQYLAKNPNGYCGLGGTGVRCPTGLLSTE